MKENLEAELLSIEEYKLEKAAESKEQMILGLKRIQETQVINSLLEVRISCPIC